MGRTRELCTFWCEGRLFGVDIGRLREVVRYQPPTRVPLSATDVCGLTCFRGQIVPVIDLGQRLGLPLVAKTRMPVNLILEMTETPIALIVDSVEDVTDVDEDHIEPPPPNFDGVERSYVEGVYRTPDRLIVILNPDAIVGTPAPASVT